MVRQKEEAVEETRQSRTLRLFHVMIYRPSGDPRAPEDDMRPVASSDRFLFVEADGQPTPAAEAKKRLQAIEDLLPRGWTIKVTEVPFEVIRGTPIIVGTCPRGNSCENFGKQVYNKFFCGHCGEVLQLTWLSAEE